MLKHLVSLFLMASMVLVVDISEAFGQKGRSYSSGRSSSSSSSRPSGKTYSSGSSNKGSSFSTKPSTPSKPYSPPQAQSPSGKKYSSGAPSTPPASSSVSAGKQYSSGSSPAKSNPPQAQSPSGNKYSSGSGSPGSPGSSASSNKQYTQGSPPPSTGPPVSNRSADGNSRKPSGSGFANAMSNDANRVQSQKRYEAATAPKATYTSKGADGKTVEQKIKPDSPEVQTVRRTVNNERYVTYENRANTFYGPSYGSPMPYHDSFSPFLMGWLLSDAINSSQRAAWMYHHQPNMDQARYDEMLKRDSKLQAEIDQLKAQNVPRDPNYVPPQMADNPDLMFNKEFVDAAYNPVEVKEAKTESGLGTFFFWMFILFMVVVVGCFGIYFMFMKEY